MVLPGASCGFDGADRWNMGVVVIIYKT